MLDAFFQLLIALLPTRLLIAGYDGRCQKRYLLVKNKLLSKILLPKTYTFERKKRPKKDLNKMCMAGIIFYILDLAAVLSVPVFIFCVPDFSVEPLIFESDSRFKWYVYADTLNEKLFIILMMLLLSSKLIYSSICCIRRTYLLERKKSSRIFLYVICAVLLLIFTLLGVIMIKELVYCFL